MKVTHLMKISDLIYNTYTLETGVDYDTSIDPRHVKKKKKKKKKVLTGFPAWGQELLSAYPTTRGESILEKHGLDQ